MELPIPKLRHGSYFPSFLTPRRLSEAALTSVIHETCVPGDLDVQCRSSRAIHGLIGLKLSEDPRSCPEFDIRAGSFLNRLLEGQWSVLWLEATCVKVRGSGRIVLVAVILALGVNDQGRRKVLGLEIGCGEAETFRPGFLRQLPLRGLCGVPSVIFDNHQG